MRLSTSAVAARVGFAPASASELGALRAWLFGVLVLWALLFDPGAQAELATLHWTPRSVFRLLPGPPGVEVLAVARAALVVAAGLAAVGLWTRPAQVAATVIALPLMGLHDIALGKTYHLTALAALLLVALLPARTADGFSLDRLRRRPDGPPHVAGGSQGGSGPPLLDVAYGWPLAVARIIVVAVYAGAGLAKLQDSGLAYLVDPASFQAWLYVKLDRMATPSPLGLWVAQRPLATLVAAWGTIGFELGAPAALWWPRLRPWLAAGAVVFHVASAALLGLSFWLMAAVAWAPLVDLTALGRRLRALLPARSRVPLERLAAGTRSLP